MTHPCPHCSKGPFSSKASLDRHVSKYHGGPPADPPADPPATPAQAAIGTDPAAQPLNVTKPPAGKSYYCIDCGSDIKKGAATCPTCGAVHDWSAVK
ncbi:hypothetical protein Dform_00854 [Dehalogenimonas formicexedens]|uniref:Uncharacterized protein n=1 Tax=Dehalogenimonas formicexedens TaxID=1839801 RepID=A0A1P8F6U3_9CHLR|nr:hypothetical protein [Dehalogenimonas formicexedens]APV44199.1 hypothetical protein Dform_00854 [Dehalogenimonas formicexedens]